MSVHYIVDGYNATRAVGLGGKSLENERKELIRFLAQSRPQGSANNRVTVFFDSRENIFSPTERQAGIEIRFSRGRSADDAIVDFVEEAANPKEIVLVTNDRGLKQRIQGTGAKTLGVQEFLERGK